MTEVGRGKGLGVVGFSPHGDRILFADDRGLWSIRVDGSGPHLLIDSGFDCVYELS